MRVIHRRGNGDDEDVRRGEIAWAAGISEFYRRAHVAVTDAAGRILTTTIMREFRLAQIVTDRVQDFAKLHRQGQAHITQPDDGNRFRV